MSWADKWPDSAASPLTVRLHRQRLQPRDSPFQVHQAEWQVPSRHVILLRQRGGKLVGETRNGTNLSGKSIEGGTAQKFGKGDFLIVPSGVAHQFVDVQSPVVVMSMYLPDAK